MKITNRQGVPLALFLALAGTLAAQDDPPSRVARLSYMSGQVSFEPSTVNEWVPATLNYPLTTGDNLYTDNGALASLRVSRNSIRLAQGTNFQMVNLSDQVAQMSINSGTIDVRIRSLYDGESWEVDTPNGAVTLLRAGEYRIDTDPSRNATMITVRNGDVEVTSNNQSFPVHAHETAYLDPNGQPDIREMNAPDEFDQFGRSRDRIEDAPPPRYLSPEVTGYEDLAAYGTWQSTPDYGEVWMPRVESGWAPYHDGHWAWVGPWGWTWVDDSPWGFAPFHYGRWARVNDSWGWVPGPLSVRPVYAPALVAFVGGGGFGIGIGIGGGGGGGAIGWFALGPREAYYPAYHVSNEYVRNVNISNTTINNITVINNNTNIRNVTYANQRVNGAVTAVPQNTFASGASVQRAAVHIAPEQMRTAQVVAAAPVAPQRASVLAAGNHAGGPVARPPANVLARPVVAKIAPPPPPVRFEAQQQALAQNPGRPVAPQQLQTIRRSAPAPAPRAPITTVNPSQVHAFTPVPRTGPAPAMNTPQTNQPGRPMVNNPALNPNASRPVNTPPPPAVNRPVQPPPNAERPVNTQPPPARPAYNERPQNAPPPVVNRPVQPPPNAERPVNTQPPPARPAYNERPQNAPPPVVNRPVQPPPNAERPVNTPPPPARPAYNERPVNTPPPPAMNRPVQPPPNAERPVNTPPPPARPAYNERPVNTPPPVVNRPAPPPPRQEARPAPPPPQQRPAPTPAEKAKEEKDKAKQ